MTLYEVLGVERGADDATVRRAYVALARRHHPDVAGGDASLMRAANDAWATLGDPVRRAAYDRALAAAEHDVARPTFRMPATEADPFDADVDDDDRPVRVTVRLPGWVSMVPVALLGAAVLAFVAGLVLVSKPLIGFALMCLVLCFIFFLAAPFIALFAARTGDSGDESAR